MRIPGREQAGRNLIKWSEKDDWALHKAQVFAEHLLPIQERFELSENEIPRLLGEYESVLYAFIMEDFFSARFGEEDLNIVDHYLKRHGWRETAPAKRYLEALRDSGVSLYEIVDLDPGNTMTVRDMILNDAPVTVEEKAGSQSAVRWDCIAARIVTLNGTPLFTGCLLHFQRETANEMLQAIDEWAVNLKADFRKMMKQAGSRSRLTSRELREMLLEDETFPQMFTDYWLTDALGRILAPLPEIQNMDGEAFLFCEVHFPVKGSKEEIAAILDGIDILIRDDPAEATWTWLGPHPSQQKGKDTTKHERKLGIDTKNELGQTALGVIAFASGALVLSVNSQERAARGRDLLAPRLGDLVGSPLTSHITPQQALKERTQQPLAEPDFPVVSEEAQQELHAYMDDHYRRVLDEPVPMLGGKTPRQAATTRKGRAQVIDWLKGLENSTLRQPASQGQKPYDMAWMWNELGITRPGY